TPLSRVRRTLSSAVRRSPLPATGIPTAARTCVIAAQSANGSYRWARVRPCTARPWIPVASSRVAISRKFRVPASHPRRILAVTGTATAPTMASLTRQARSGSRSKDEPPEVLTTFGTGQPMLMSTMSAPAASAILAASAITPGSPPISCTETGRWSQPRSISRNDSRCRRTSASLLIISVQASPAPNSRAILRKGASVTPAIGATYTGELRVYEPSFTGLPAYQPPRRNRTSSRRAITPSIKITPTFCGLMKIANRVAAAMKIAAGSRMGGVRSGRRGGGWPGGGGARPVVHLIDEPQPLEHQALIDQLDHGCLGGDQPGKTAGGDHAGFVTELFATSADHAL